jgi:hypothetical protein
MVAVAAAAVVAVVVLEQGWMIEWMLLCSESKREKDKRSRVWERPFAVGMGVVHSRWMSFYIVLLRYLL